jgi:HSP20 family protein
MQLVRWSPGSDLLNLHSELDRVFNELIPGPAASPQVAEMARAAILPLDIRRDGDQLVIEAAIPGFKPDEVEVTVDNGLVTIDARHEQDFEDTNGKGRGKGKDSAYVRRERYSGRLFRQVQLPVDVVSDKAQAQFKDGMLIVRLPLAKKTEPKRIPVSAGGESTTRSTSSSRRKSGSSRQTATAGSTSGKER